MPIVDILSPDIGSAVDTPKGFAVTPGQTDLDHGSDAPTVGATLGAAFRQDNTVGALLSGQDLNSPIDVEEGFNPWDKIKGTPYEAKWENFVDIRNSRALDDRKRQLDQEAADKRTLEAAPFYVSFPAQMAAGVIDLPTLLPGGAFVRGAKGGFSVARSALEVGAAAGVSAAAQEAALQTFEQTRSAGESAVNIGASVLLGGLLGAGGAKVLTAAEWSGAVKAIERELGAATSTPETVRLYRGEGGSGAGLAGEPAHAGSAMTGGWFTTDLEKAKLYGDVKYVDVTRDELAHFAQGHGGADEFVTDNPAFRDRAAPLNDESSSGALTSAGAAAVGPGGLEGNSIAGKMAGSVAAVTARMNPALRLLESPSAYVRDTATKLFENSVYLKKNMDGIASEPAVETLMKEWNGGLAKAVRSTNEAYPEYRKAGGQLSRDEFREAVGRAMRRGDEGGDPFVTKVAQEWRAKVFDPLKVAAIEAGLLPADVSVETAASYFSRMWNRNKLVAQEGRFKTIARQWVEDNAPKWAEAFDKGTERTLAPLHQEISDLEMGKLRRAEEVKQRANEIQAGDFGEGDIRQALRIVEGGAPRPKGVETLTQFVAKAGGLVDFGGELAHRGITNKTRPGFVRSERKRAQTEGGGWSLDDMTRHAWESGYFPEHIERPSIEDFLNALQDDFFKTRAVVKQGDRDAFRLQELVSQLEDDLARVGARAGRASRFSTSEEVKGIVSRVYKALDAEADRKIAALKAKLAEREATARVERDARFLGDPKELSNQIANEVFDKLTGKTPDAIGSEFVTVKARGPLKERTFNIPDHLVEDFLEHDAELVGRRYARVMGADVELARKFGSVDMKEQLQKLADDYRALRAGVMDEKKLAQLEKAEKSDRRDIEALRDLLRSGSIYTHPVEQSYSRIVRGANHFNYLLSMGEVVLASLTDVVRPAMVHGLGQFMTTVPQLIGNLKGIKLSTAEAQLAGNVTERVLGHRLATISEIIDPYASRGPVEAFLENMTNVASKWNGIRIWTDAMKSVASVMTQNRVLSGVTDFGKIKKSEKAYLAYLGVDESMAERIAAQFGAHGETVGGVKVANTAEWTDPVAVRAYRAAINKDVDSIIIQKSVADVPLFASTPTGRTILQFKSFALASHQKVLLRGLQESQARFVGGIIGMTAVGMMITYLKAISGNRPETQQKAIDNPGWWIGEGFDRAGIVSVPMEIANAFEKATGFNVFKTPLQAMDQTSSMSQKNQNRSLIGSLLGPSAGTIDNLATTASIPKTLYNGDEITKGQKSAAERILPFNSYAGMRQMLRYVVNPPQ